MKCPRCGFEGDEEPEEKRDRVAFVGPLPVQRGVPPNEHELEMMETVRRFLDRLPPERREAPMLRAVPLITGEDRAAWMGPDGKEAPWGERPRLFRLALVEAMQSGRKVRNVLRYKIIPEQLYPHPQRAQRLAVEEPAREWAGGGGASAIAPARTIPTLDEVRAQQERKAREEEARVRVWRERVEPKLGELSDEERDQLRRRALAELAPTRGMMERLGHWERTLEWRYLQLCGERLGMPLYPSRSSSG